MPPFSYRRLYDHWFTQTGTVIPLRLVQESCPSIIAVDAERENVFHNLIFPPGYCLPSYCKNILGKLDILFFLIYFLFYLRLLSILLKSSSNHNCVHLNSFYTCGSNYFWSLCTKQLWSFVPLSATSFQVCLWLSEINAFNVELGVWACL